MISLFHFFAVITSCIGMLYCLQENNIFGFIGWFVAAISQFELLMKKTK